MNRFDTTGGYVFCKYRPARVVWREFQDWWGRTHPGSPLPALHNLPELTGLPLRTIQHFARQGGDAPQSGGSGTDSPAPP